MSTRLANVLFWVYLLFIVWGSTTAYNPADPDLWHRLALGEALWKTGHFPPGDAFSYLADYQNIADHEWGSALIFYGLYQLGGEGAMVGIKIVALAVTVSLLVWAGTINRHRSVFTAAFYALVVLALLPSFQSTVRCMVFTHIFFALWLYWFQRERQGRPVPTWCYVLTIIPWANLHGGFTIGLAWLFCITLLGFFMGETESSAPLSHDLSLGFSGLLASDKMESARFRLQPGLPMSNFWSARKWGLRLCLCLLATLINPFGPHLWITTARALLITRQGFPEWAPVSWWENPLAYPGYKLLLFAVVVALGVQIHRRGWKKVDRPVVLIITLVALLSLSSARHTSFLAVVAGAFVPAIFPLDCQLGAILDPLRRLGFMAIGSFVLVFPLYSTFQVMPGDGLALRYTDVACPVGAVEYLRDNEVRGKLLVPFNYGSYSLWELRGRMRVSMDGRYDLVYRPETYRRVDDFFYARGDWRKLLTSPAPNAILVPKADSVYSKLLEEPGWREAWHDRTDVVFLPK